jgi:hypothetical protein
MKELLPKALAGIGSAELLQVSPMPIATATEIVKLLGQIAIAIYTIYTLVKTKNRKDESSKSDTRAEN